jgi:hypothetical protein
VRAPLALLVLAASTPRPGPALGPLSGPTRPGPGLYRLALDARSSEYPTREKHLATSAKGTADLALTDDGSAVLSLKVETHQSYSVSHFASHDGQDHRDESRGKWDERFKGSWRLEGEAVVLTLSQADRQYALRCARWTHGAMPLLACRAEEALPEALAAVAVQAGPQGDEAPWLVLGEGARLGLSFELDRGQPRAELTRAKTEPGAR